jgi:hypothetical protein
MQHSIGQKDFLLMFLFILFLIHFTCTAMLLQQFALAVPWLRWLLVSHHGGPGSHPDQSIWDLWWTKWHWDRFSSSSSVFPSQYHSSVALHSHILSRR